MYRVVLIALLSPLFCASAIAQTVPDIAKATTKTKRARIVEDVPGPNINAHSNFIRVNAERTPSGYPVPRYVSLKYGRSFGRTGPSSEHPVAWEYKRSGLPMIVVAETEIWRKVRDVNGDESWMNRRLLDGKRSILARSDLVLRAKPRSDSRARAQVAKGALLVLEECLETDWCKVKDENSGTIGYGLRTLFWGAERL